MSAWDDPITHIRELEAEVSRLRKEKAELTDALAASNATMRRATDALALFVGQPPTPTPLRVVDEGAP